MHGKSTKTLGRWAWWQKWPSPAHFLIMPHIWPSFFLSPVILPVYLQMTKIVTGNYLCFADKFHHVEKYEPFFVWIRSYRTGVVTNCPEVKNIDFQWASWRRYFNNSAFFLVVTQTSDMQWTYDILGTTADYNPPNGRARIRSTSANSARLIVKQKKNYVLENLKLQSTAVSSPYKGVRLVSRLAR